MRITVPLVIEMSDEQVERYSYEYSLNDTRAKTIVDDVRSSVLTGVQGLLDDLASVTIKR